jgi:hypothetical protein
VSHVINRFQEATTLVVLPSCRRGEDDRVDGEVAARAVADFVVGDRIEVLVDQLGWVVLLGKTGGAGVLASYGDDCKVVFGAD